MSQPAITITAQSVNNIALMLDIRGDLTASADQALTQAYTRAVLAEMRVVILNFSNMDYMNSSGIGILVTFLIQVHKKKQQVFAFGLNEHYKHIFHLTRLSDSITIYDSEVEAIKALLPIAQKQYRTEHRGKR